MDRFRTQVKIPVSPVKISHQTKSLLMGSCFAENIGKVMAGYKFPVGINPFGTLFNPLSISANIDILLSGKTYAPDDLLFHDGLWLSFDYYTGFSNTDRETCLSDINRSCREAADFLKNCDYLMLTFGTARAYIFKETGKIAANCHKLPASSFLSKVFTPSEILSNYTTLLENLKKYNPSLKVIFTVSPVRHWADGAVNNQLSKSILHVVIHELIKNHPDTYYFPAYEIFMDELRDYRFYAPDMLHVSETGISYVWERFCETWIDSSSRKVMADVEDILKAVGHRPLHADTTNYKKFIQNTLKQIELLNRSHPFLDFSKEIALLNTSLR